MVDSVSQWESQTLSSTSNDPAAYVPYADRGWSNHKIAKHFGVWESTVRRGLDRIGYKRYLVPTDRQPDRFTFDLDKPIVHVGDAMITADWHIPLYDPDLVNNMIEKARELELTDLVIGGDFFNFDALSQYDPKQDSAGLDRELAEALAVMRVLLETFERIYYIWGNHDNRLTKTLGFKLRFEDAMRLMFGELGEELLGRLVFSGLDHIWIESGTQTYYICHPANYTRTPLATARTLATKYHANVVTAHSHHFAAGSDISGDLVVAEAGGLFDRSKTSYLQRSTTFPTWCQGYAWIKDGRLSLTSPLWGMND